MRKNKRKESIMTRFIGINGKSGSRQQLNLCLLLLLNLDFSLISSIVLTPFVESLTDHSNSIFDR